MLLPILFAGLLGQATLMPPDSTTTSGRTSGHGFLLGTAISIADQEHFRVANGPVAGYYKFWDLGKSLTVQIELQGKIATGYRVSTVFEDYVVNPEGLSVSRATFHLRSLFFLEMPVLFKVRRDRTSRHQFFAGVRPSINAITSEKSGGISTEVSNGVFPTDMSGLNLREAVQRYDLGIVGGWSYAFSPRVSLDVRYSHGLYDLTADNFFKSKANTLNADLQVSLRANF